MKALEEAQVEFYKILYLTNGYDRRTKRKTICTNEKTSDSSYGD